MSKRILLLLLATFAATACSRREPATPSASGKEAAQRIVDDSATAIKGMRSDAKFSSIEPFLKDARAVVIFPRLIKASFIFGGEGGTGVLVGRSADGSYSAPAFYGLGAGSVGPQIGYQEASVVLLLMNDHALSSLLRSGFTLGADVSVAAGTLGDSGKARSATTAKDVISFVDVGGLFAGASVDGAVVKPRPTLDRA